MRTIWNHAVLRAQDPGLPATRGCWEAVLVKHTEITEAPLKGSDKD